MKRILTTTIALMLCLVVNAKQFTMVTQGQGTTKEEAIQNALYEAVRQTSGALLTESASIKNDELVASQTASFTKGKVMKYKVLGAQKNPETKQWDVSIEVTIESDKLLKYTSSKGNTAQVDGASFVMNKKIADLQKKNELLVVKDLLNRMYDMHYYVFDFKIEASEPQYNTTKQLYEIEVSVKPTRGNAFKAFNEMEESTLKALSMNKDDIKEYESFFRSRGYSWGGYTFRNQETAKLLSIWLLKMYIYGRQSFVIQDNLGNRWSPTIGDESAYSTTFFYTENELSQFTGITCSSNTHAIFPVKYEDKIHWIPDNYSANNK